MNRRKLLLKGSKFKESKHDRFGKRRPAVTAAKKIDERSTEADVSAFRRSIRRFFFYDRLRTLDLRFLLWMYLAKHLLERFRSARQKAITFFAAHLAESSLREELALADRWSSWYIAAATDWSKPKEQRVFQRGLRAQARKSELKSSPGPAILLDMRWGFRTECELILFPSQVIDFRCYSTASDVWSFGVLLFEIWSFGQTPYGLWSNDKVCSSNGEWSVEFDGKRGLGVW